jgi:SAM-dependent methyltransferase
MNKQFEHAILPKTDRDELARQEFIRSLKTHLMGMTPKIREIYEKKIEPHSPKNRYEIRDRMQQEPYYQWVSALKRITQEMLWDSVNTSVDRQLPELIAKAKDNKHSLSSLTLDRDMPFPAYQKAVDIHCMPGSYHGESGEDDLAAGAVYDRGVYIYGRGWLGPLNDDLGQTAIENFLKKEYPNFQPRKILDLGCSVGHSTLPYVDAYPEAEVRAIDVAAPMLRYARARADAMGKKVHFFQQNAEYTNFAANSLDLVVSHILLHEIPVFAIENVICECYRLLSPGGMMVHVEGAMYDRMDDYGAFMYDWETANNNEPFWSAMRQLDLASVAVKAGFKPENVIQTFVPNGVWKQKENKDNPKGEGFASRGSWFIFAATK